jgi:hypothetical protein
LTHTVTSVLAILAAGLGVAAAMKPGGRLLAMGSALASAGVFVSSASLGWSVVAFVVLLHALRRRLDCAGIVMVGGAAGAVIAHGQGLREITLFGIGFIALKALLVGLLLDIRKPREQQPDVALGSGLLLLTLALVVARVIDVVGTLSMPVEASWAEAPLLVDMLKLDAHQPLYGPLDQVNSYSYSPLLQLLHHAVLAPFHAELSLGANRALTLVDLFAASLLVSWAVRPLVVEGLDGFFPARARVWGLAVALLVGFSSMLAGSVHPDHPSLVCVAVAVALVLREESWPRWLWWSALLLVTPVAVAFKLTGAGVGLGLGAVMLVERRFKACLVLGVSALLSVATVPLFDATCGAFSTYAIAMQRSHPIEWPRVFWAPTIHFAAATAMALGLALMLVRAGDTVGRVALRRIALLFGGVIALMLPAYLKLAGRENNLHTLFGACVLVVLVAAARSDKHPLLGPTAILYITMLVWTPRAPLSVAPVPLGDQVAEVLRTMTADDRSGQKTLVPSAALWIAHGRRDVPVDRTNTAYELFYGHHPEAEIFFRHIEDGRYHSAIFWSGDVERERAPAFADRLSRALEGYDRVYPPPNVPIAAVGYVIYSRKP